MDIRDLHCALKSILSEDPKDVEENISWYFAVLTNRTATLTRGFRHAENMFCRRSWPFLSCSEIYKL